MMIHDYNLHSSYYYQPVQQPASSGLGMTAGDWMSAGTGLIGSLLNFGSSIYTNKVNREINQSNIDLQRETNAMNEALTREQWNRDDSQLQRAREDAVAAGFSPMAALSNNLTNSSAIPMQSPQAQANQIAPQIDLSHVGNVFSQAALKSEQTESIRLQNQFNRETLNIKKLQTAAELMKMYKDLDSQDLSNAQRASILVASGFKASDVKQLIGHTNLGEVPRNTSQDAENNLKTAQSQLANAQKLLVDAQTTTENKQQALIEAQTALVTIEHTMKTNENDYQWNQKVSMNVPVVTISGNQAKIDWTWSDSIPRRQAFDLYKNAIDILTAKRSQQEINSDTFDKFFKALDAIIPF